MNRETVLIALGVLVLISPWSGLPLSWLAWILAGIGLAVVGIGLTLRPRTPRALPPAEPPMQHPVDSEPTPSRTVFS